eukprot:20085-Heterococcus_DN1.PRE.2
MLKPALCSTASKRAMLMWRELVKHSSGSIRNRWPLGCRQTCQCELKVPGCALSKNDAVHIM